MIIIAKKIAFTLIVLSFFCIFFHNLEIFADYSNPVVQVMNDIEKKWTQRINQDKKKETRNRSKSF